VVTDHLYRAFPDRPESELSKIRASVVSGETLAEVARTIELGTFLLLGKGEQRTGGRDRTSILSDGLEAVFGGIYLDGGWEQAERVILGLLGDRIAEAAIGPGSHEYKSQLQELAARIDENPPRYTITEDDGPPHDKRYFASVRLGERVVGEGEGRSKKQAETAAAREAWERLSGEDAVRAQEQDSLGEDA
jgi:ribonuclease-3